MCKEDNSIKLEDDTNKIVLNTKGIINDLNEELIEFLEYVEHSNSEIAEKSKGTLVKKIHKKVTEVKSDTSVEVEFMTLLERDREKIEEGREEGREEGIELARKVFRLLSKGELIENIAKICGISEDKVREIIG